MGALSGLLLGFVFCGVCFDGWCVLVVGVFCGWMLAGCFDCLWGWYNTLPGWFRMWVFWVPVCYF